MNGTQSDGQMCLYDADWAPSPRRVRFFLAEKGVEIPVRKVNLRGGEHGAPEFLAISPRGTLPALVLEDGTVLDDSNAICRYVEALYPEPPLFGSNPMEIGLIEAWLRRIDAECYQAVVMRYRNGQPAFAANPVTGIWPVRMPQLPELVARGAMMWDVLMDFLESRMGTREWIATDSFSYADIYALCAIDFGVATKLDIGERPAIRAWHARMAERPGASA